MTERVLLDLQRLGECSLQEQFHLRCFRLFQGLDRSYSYDGDKVRQIKDQRHDLFSETELT